MMKFIPVPIRLIVAIVLLGTPSCSIFSSKKDSAEVKTDKARTLPQLIGRVASVPPDKRFILIENYGKWEVQPGSILTTRGPEGRAANLLATGEHLGQFAAADVQSGEVKVGDPVFDRPEIKKEPAQQPEISPDLPASLRAAAEAQAAKRSAESD